MNVFDEAKSRTDIIDIAERYGIAVKRGKALCIFHNDSQPSMSFKNNYFKCWSCGASGSGIDLVMRLFNVSAIEAVKILNQDFRLNLELNKPVSKARIQEVKEDNQLYEAFIKWENGAYSILCEYLHILQNYKMEYAPKTISDDYNPLFVEALRDMSYVEYLIDFLFEANFEEKLKFYKTGKELIKNYEYKIRKNTSVKG